MSAIRITAALSLAALTACAPGDRLGTDTGNALDVGVTGLSAARRALGELSITGAWIAVEEIRVEPCGAIDDDARSDFEGPFAVDLLSGLGLGTVALPEDDYCSVRLDVHELDDSQAAGSPLAERSVWVEGVTADGTPFEIASDRNESFRVEDDGGVLVPGADGEGVLITFLLGVWLDDLDLSGAQVSGGVIRVDDDYNGDLLERFEDNLRDSAELYENSDGDLVPDL